MSPSGYSKSPKNDHILEGYLWVTSSFQQTDFSDQNIPHNYIFCSKLNIDLSFLYPSYGDFKSPLGRFKSP